MRAQLLFQCMICIYVNVALIFYLTMQVVSLAVLIGLLLYLQRGFWVRTQRNYGILAFRPVIIEKIVRILLRCFCYDSFWSFCMGYIKFYHFS